MMRAMRCAVVALAAVVLLAETAAAQYERPQPIDRSASREARKRQQEAQVEFNRRNATVKAITARIRANFEQRDKWIKAQADLKAAQAALEGAKKPVLAKLASNPAYRKAVEAKQKAEAERDALKGSRSTDKLYEAAGKAIDANFAVVKMENEALAADLKVQAAQKQLDSAEAMVAALNDELEQELESNVEWVEAQKAMQESQLMVAQATKELQEATRREAEQARSQSESARQSRRSSRGGGLGGGRSY